MLSLSTTASTPPPADPTPPAPVAPTAEPATPPGAPAPADPVCASRRVVRVHVDPQPGRRLRATVGGSAVAVRNGVVVADLRGRAPGRYSVVVRDGRVVTRRVLCACVAD